MKSFRCSQPFKISSSVRMIADNAKLSVSGGNVLNGVDRIGLAVLQPKMPVGMALGPTAKALAT